MKIFSICTRNIENKITDVEEFITQNQEIIDNEIQSIKSNNFVVSKPIQNNFSFDEYYSVGKLFNTYIVLENPQKTDLILIDQHAAHERLLYDSFIESISKNNRAMQPLLLPYIFNVNKEELEVFLNNCDSLKQCGFAINAFGNNTLKIDAVPLQFSDINLESFVNYLISDVDSSSINDFTYEYIAKKLVKLQ
jgi:DNA mismatch repair enzyme (predicted ATPase)